jgi:cell division septal protein FtsQ
MKRGIRDYKRKKYFNPFFKKRVGRGDDFYYGAGNRKAINFWKKIIIFFIFLIFVCLFACLIYVIFFYPYFFIKNIEISGLEKIGEGEIRKEIEDQMAESRFMIFKQENIFILDKNELLNRINSKYNLVSLNVDRELPNILRVGVEEKQPVLIWKTKELFYEVDGLGSIIRETLPTDLNSELPVIYDENNAETTIRASVLSAKMIQFIINLKKMIDDRSDIKIAHFNALKNELKVKTQAGWEIYLSMNNDLEKQAEKLFLFLKNKKIEAGNNLNYIDLRFEDRIYYK